MKCFEHQQLDAVGLCKKCGRAVCSNCATLEDDVVTCRTTCASGKSADLVRVGLVIALFCLVSPFAAIASFRALEFGFFWSVLVGVGCLALAFALAIRPTWHAVRRIRHRL
jgi:hypothetical protein